MPCSFTALDKVRIEAGLLFYGYDMTDENTPWEVCLRFAIAKATGDFRCKSGPDSRKRARGGQKSLSWK
jgi:aminomethyltransferase